jgi:hypothetical protein
LFIFQPLAGFVNQRDGSKLINLAALLSSPNVCPMGAACLGFEHI